MYWYDGARRCWSCSSRSRSPTTIPTTPGALSRAVGDPPGRASSARSDYRGYAGQMASGALRAGEEVVVLPSGQRTSIAAIDTYDGELPEALAPMSVTLRLQDEIDISRGEMICRPDAGARRWRASWKPTCAG